MAEFKALFQQLLARTEQNYEISQSRPGLFFWGDAGVRVPLNIL